IRSQPLFSFASLPLRITRCMPMVHRDDLDAALARNAALTTEIAELREQLGNTDVARLAAERDRLAEQVRELEKSQKALQKKLKELVAPREHEGKSAPARPGSPSASRLMHE